MLCCSRTQSRGRLVRRTWENPARQVPRFNLHVQGHAVLRHAQPEFTSCVGYSQRIHPFEASELRRIRPLNGERPDLRAGYGLSLVIYHSAAADAFGSAVVEIVRVQFHGHGSIPWIHAPGGMDWHIALSHGQELEHQVGIEIFQDKLALPIADSPFLAVRIARGSEHPNALARPRGADKYAGSSYRFALVVLYHTHQRGTILGRSCRQGTACEGGQSQKCMHWRSLR